jgi:hypothetical protein
MGRVGWRPNPGTVSITRLLDTYTGSAAAYSLRKLNSSYSGPVITVRRSSDNTSQDIGFNANGDLDTTSLLSFVGSNLTQYTEEFDNAYWNKFNSTITPNSTIAPDGTMTADLLQETATSSIHGIMRSNVFYYTANTSWNTSVYVKKGPGANAPSTVALGYDGNNFDTNFAVFDIVNGQVLSTGFRLGDIDTGASITDSGNGWWRISFWGKTTVNGNRNDNLCIRFNNNMSAYQRLAYLGKTDANIYIWGFQFVRKLNDDTARTLIPYQKASAVAGANGYVTRWYDQSGSSLDASQITAAKQPQVVSGGSILYLNSKPKLFFDGVDDFLVTPSYTFNSTSKLYVAHVSLTTNQTYQMVFGQFKNSNPSVFLTGYWSQSGSLKFWASARESTNVSSRNYLYNTFATNIQYLTEYQFDTLNSTSANRLRGYLNGSTMPISTNGGATTVLPTLTQPLSIGADELGTGFKFRGDIQEIVYYYGDDKVNDRSGIASNINSYYTIY